MGLPLGGVALLVLVVAVDASAQPLKVQVFVQYLACSLPLGLEAIEAERLSAPPE